MQLVVTLLAGITAGAVGLFLLLRPALLERRRLERDLAAATALLSSAEQTLDQRVRDAIRAETADVMERNSSAFLELAGVKLEGYVTPIKDGLAKVETTVQSLERNRVRDEGALRDHVTMLGEGVNSLRNALRSPHVRGRWGEAQLRNVVERAGMLEYCDFVMQATTRDADGDLLRPDLIVRVPGGKSVVVDAKVPLAAYLDAFETTDEAAKRDLLAGHARQVRDHVGKLAAKAYWRQFAPAPDFVVMFVPDETLLRVAHEYDPGLSETAWSNNVILASPSTLMTLLRTVAAIWREETAAESARELLAIATELHKRLCTFGGHMVKMGRSLTTAVGSYNEAVGSFESRVLPQARRLEEHGIDGKLDAPAPVDRLARQPALDPSAEPRSLEVLPGDANAA